MSEMSLAEQLVKAGARLTREDASGARRDLDTVQKAGITSVGELIEAVGDANRELPVRLIGCSLLALLHENSATAALEQALEEGDDDGLVWEAEKCRMTLHREHRSTSIRR